MTAKKLLLFCLVVGIAGLSLCFGSERTLDSEILWNLRLPRLVIVLVAGGCLSMVGSAYQSIFRNALAEPYLLGISSAVALGAVLTEYFLKVPVGSAGGMAIASVLCILVSLLLLSVTDNSSSQQVERIVLFGMALNFVLSSALFLFLSYSNQQLGAGSMRWLFGQIPWLPWSEVIGFSVFVLLGLTLLWIYGRSVDALSLGDGVARSLGTEPRRTRGILLTTTSVLVGMLMMTAGPIGFVGLVVPHFCKLCFSPSHSRQLFCLSFIVGGAFLMLSDLVARTLYPPFEFPIGLITTLVGGPLFLWLLWKR